MYTKILVPLDGSEFDEHVLPYVKWFVKVSEVDEIIFLRVVEPLHITRGLENEIIPEERQHIEQDAVRLAEDYLVKLAGQFRRGQLKIKTAAVIGKPARAIAEYVGHSRADLIIMATHGFSGLHRLVSGSVAAELLHNATVPLFLVTPRDRPPDK
ncbi:MAG: hypothetical protein A2137_06010 [Chloroflexi bacterium RBG_16_58_8]|nr:MAG: hypothetical protein A2137_06010 [Chloroflexi bacterium RBG_16_58_8]